MRYSSLSGVFVPSCAGKASTLAAMVSRVLYTIVGAAGLWSISLLFTGHEHREETTHAAADGAGA